MSASHSEPMGARGWEPDFSEKPMITNPYEECPPCEPQRTVTIKARELDNGVWEVWCPEWKCTLHNRNLTLCVADLLAEIQNHNDDCRGKITTNDMVKWAAKEGLPKLKPEQWPKQPPKKFGKRKTIPDDGSRTPCEFWQKPF